MESLLSKFVCAWEYKRYASNYEVHEELLNAWGNEGWELTGFSMTGTYYVYIFKRRKFSKNQD